MHRKLSEPLKSATSEILRASQVVLPCRISRPLDPVLSDGSIWRRHLDSSRIEAPCDCIQETLQCAPSPSSGRCKHVQDEPGRRFRSRIGCHWPSCLFGGFPASRRIFPKRPIRHSTSEPHAARILVLGYPWTVKSPRCYRGIRLPDW